MALPAQVRVNVLPMFPARARGTGFISVAKANGVYTFQYDYDLLSRSLAIPAPTTKDLVIKDTDTGQYNTVTIAQIAAAAASIVSTSGLTGAILNTYRIVTA